MASILCSSVLLRLLQWRVLFSEFRYVEFGRESRKALVRIAVHPLLSYKQVLVSFFKERSKRSARNDAKEKT
jgi:hypothetical protein